MKNIFRVALLTALACLLCFSCTNINDPETLTADKFTVNEMKVEGFYVEGLASSYDGKTIELVYVTKDKDGKDVETVVGTSATVADVASLYKSGATMVKFANPVVVKGNGTYYLKLEDGEKVQVLNKKMELDNAELEMLTSPYGTKEDKLVSKMVVVKAVPVSGKNIPATFAWEDATNVNKPVAKFYIIGDLPGVTSWSWDDSDKLIMTAKSATEQEWTYKATETKTIEFKFTNDPSWSATINAGAASEDPGVQDVKLGTAYTMTLGASSKNLKLAVTKDKEYVFVLNVADTSKPKVTVTEK